MARTPLRLPLAGGGTDFPPYVAECGGRAVTAAINQYVTIIVAPRFEDDYCFKYSQVEVVDTVDAIQHPIIREVIRFYDVPRGIELLSLADIPGGTGLGSSAAFTVSLCHALSRYVGIYLDRRTLAAHAAEIELGILGRGGGCQDHYACALGDLNVLQFNQDGTVDDDPLFIAPDVLEDLETHLRLYFTGYSRDADAILRTQSAEGLDVIKAQGELARKALEAGDLPLYGQLLNEHWAAKRERSPVMSSPEIDRYHQVAMDNGAIGAKLVGAGGGGFILCMVRDHAKLSEAMKSQGLREVPFRFDHMGAVVSCNA